MYSNVAAFALPEGNGTKIMQGWQCDLTETLAFVACERVLSGKNEKNLGCL